MTTSKQLVPRSDSTPFEDFSQGFAPRPALSGIRRRVDQPERGVRADAQFRDLGARVQVLENGDPKLDVTSLKCPDRVLLITGEAVEVSILNPDHVGVVEREPHVEFDQGAQRQLAIRCPGDHSRAAIEQILAHTDQHRREEGVFALEVSVDGGATHTDGGSEVLDGHPVEPALGEVSRGGVEKRLAPSCLRFCAPDPLGRGAPGGRGRGDDRVVNHGVSSVGSDAGQPG
jgi:hypothetical protein